MRECARIIILILVALCLIACRTVKYIPVETAKIDTTYVVQLKVDSIYHRDSVYIENKGDTVRIAKYEYVYKYIESKDTMWREKVDTIQVPYPVEAEPTILQKVQISISKVLISLCIAAIIAACVWYYIKSCKQ